jgi:phospholipase/carboxylesterase
MSTGLIARLLDTLDALGVIARRMHPPQLEALVATLGDRDSGLRSALAGAVWSEDLVALRDPVEHAVKSTVHACDGLRAAIGSPDGLRQTYRALRHVGRAQEALYPVAAVLPSVSRHFLEPERRDDQALLDRLTVGAPRTDVRTGVMHFANHTSERGGFSVYVPEDYDPGRAHPLVMALHGGSGHGRLFVWSWVREARSRGVILVAPTAIGQTWSLMELEVDGANLSRVLEQVAERWHVDRTRLLLTGMSDGGTFTLLSGLDEGSPFTHLAPVAASFHPMLLTMA